MFKEFNIDQKRKAIYEHQSLEQVSQGSVTTFQDSPTETKNDGNLIGSETVEIIQFIGTQLKTIKKRITLGEIIGKGAFRTCYKLTIEDDINSYVIKISNVPIHFDAIVADILVSDLATFYAKEYNKLDLPKLENEPEPVSINQQFIIVFKRGSDTYIGQGEPFLEGNFVKYNNNADYVNNEIYRNTPQAFSHFTFIYSNNSQIIVDVQGVGNTFTDLQVNSKLEEYNNCTGNRRSQGINDFFIAHKCNNLCQLIKHKLSYSNCDSYYQQTQKVQSSNNTM